MLANATTAADQLNIAEYYEEEATDAHTKYEEHAAAAIRYEHAIKFGRSSAQHCDQLAQDYQQLSRKRPCSRQSTARLRMKSAPAT
jgi:hypothetical protein